jgi:ABC-type lipoprotein export system ATPase subunit
MFDVPPTKRAELAWDVDLPLDEKPWQIGLVVGPSGSGKSTLLTEMFGKPVVPKWPKGKAVVDGFPASMSVKNVTGALSAVGFSSPSSWLLTL